MVVSEITLFNTLKAKLGEQDAQVVVEGIKNAVKEEFDSKKELLATKEDILNLKVEMERGFKENLKWNIVLIVGLFISLLSAITGILKLMLP